MRAHTRKTMKHEQENMKELLKKKYFSPLIESYDMVGENLLGGPSQGAGAGGFTPDPGTPSTNPNNPSEDAKHRFSGSFYNGFNEE